MHEHNFLEKRAQLKCVPARMGAVLKKKKKSANLRVESDPVSRV